MARKRALKRFSEKELLEDTLTGARRGRGRRRHFRYARYGARDMDRCAST